MTLSDTSRARVTLRMILAGASALALLGCSKPLDFDLRGEMGGGLDTSAAAQGAIAPRPEPDGRGIISYPNYQVAVARRGDTLASLAQRIGVTPMELARYNGIQPEDRLRAGEIIALPGRVAEPSPATGALGTGPIQPPSEVSVSTLAGAAIDRAAPTPVIQPAAAPAPVTQPQTGLEPIRHQVVRGETAFIIARKYGVTVRQLADWNSLDANFTLREGQFLLIPVAEASPPAPSTATAPGSGSPTPTPPSASTPLPEETPPPAAVKPATPAAPSLPTSSTSGAALAMPVDGAIIRDYAKGKNEGIDIGAPPDTPVRAAAAGRVAAITSDADRVPIVVIKHPDNLLTVYANITGLTVKQGDDVTRGQTIGKIRVTSPSYVHFEVREGFDSVDPTPYLE